MENIIRTFIAKVLPDLEENTTGLYALSLVEEPAVDIIDGSQVFYAFDKQETIEYKFADEEKHIVTGVIMLANTPIERYNKELGKHYITYPPETIQLMMEKAMKLSTVNNLNLQHNSEDKTNGLYLIESYIKDSTKGIVPERFSKIPDGSWIASYKVTDMDLWEEIKLGKDIKGFSLEGNFGYQEVKLSKDENKEDSFESFINELLK